MAIDEKVDDAIRLNEKTELGEVFENLDSDDTSPNSKLPTIDLNTILSPLEAKQLSIFDQFKAMGLLPEKANLGMSIKRLNVSIGGAGRKQKVNIATAKREDDSNGKIGNFMSRMFTPRQ